MKQSYFTFCSLIWALRSVFQKLSAFGSSMHMNSIIKCTKSRKLDIKYLNLDPFTVRTTHQSKMLLYEDKTIVCFQSLE